MHSESSPCFHTPPESARSDVAPTPVDMSDYTKQTIPPLPDIYSNLRIIYDENKLKPLLKATQNFS